MLLLFIYMYNNIYMYNKMYIHLQFRLTMKIVQLVFALILSWK